MCLHPPGFPHGREGAGRVENNTHARLSYLLRQDMCLVGSRERHLNCGPALILDFLLEVDKRRHDIRTLHLDDQRKGALIIIKRTVRDLSHIPFLREEARLYNALERSSKLVLPASPEQAAQRRNLCAHA